MARPFPGRTEVLRCLRAEDRALHVAEITKSGEPHGCMLVLGALNCTSEGADAAKASELLHGLRGQTYRMILQRIRRGVRDGDVPRKTDVESLAMFVCTFVNGMSVQARDGATRAALNATVDRALQVWDAVLAEK